MLPQPEKAATIKSLLSQGFYLLLSVNTRVQGVQLPLASMQALEAKIGISYKMSAINLAITDSFLKADLSFSGVKFACTIPMTAIYHAQPTAYQGKKLTFEEIIDTGVPFLDDLPEELLALAEMLDIVEPSPATDKEISFLDAIPRSASKGILEDILSEKSLVPSMLHDPRQLEKLQKIEALLKSEKRIMLAFNIDASSSIPDAEKPTNPQRCFALIEATTDFLGSIPIDAIYLAMSVSGSKEMNFFADASDITRLFMDELYKIEQSQETSKNISFFRDMTELDMEEIAYTHAQQKLKLLLDARQSLLDASSTIEQIALLEADQELKAEYLKKDCILNPKKSRKISKKKSNEIKFKG